MPGVIRLCIAEGHPQYPVLTVVLPGERKKHAALADGDWLIVADATGNVARIGRILRIRSDLVSTSVYFDRIVEVAGKSSLAAASLSSPPVGAALRVQWNDFVAALSKLTGLQPDDVPLIGQRKGKENEDTAYLRELLQLAVTDDLLGPANGPHEQIVDMGVRDRYLVGKLSPREAEPGGIEGGTLSQEDDEEPDDLEVHKGRHDPGAEFDSTTGRVDAEADSSDEIDAASNQSLVPSSFGLTFCVDGDAKQIEVEARWGR